MIQSVEPEVLAAGIGFLVIAVDMARRYINGDDIPLHKLPWLEFRALFEFGRKVLFTIDKPDHPSIEVDLSLEELKETLGKQGVKPGHKFSYRYNGEVYNAIMYAFDPSERLPHRQIHIRAFDHPGGLEVLAHTEPHWYHHPVAHLRSDDMEFEPANAWVQSRLHEHVPVGYPSD